MRSMYFVVAVFSLSLGGLSARADGDRTHAGQHTALPPPQPSVVVSLEHGVRVWRPVTDSAEEYDSQPGYQGGGVEPRQMAVPNLRGAPAGYDGYGVYGGIGGYGGFGFNRGYAVQRRNAGGRFGVPVGPVLLNRQPIIGSGRRTYVAVNARGLGSYRGNAAGHGSHGKAGQ